MKNLNPFKPVKIKIRKQRRRRRRERKRKREKIERKRKKRNEEGNMATRAKTFAEVTAATAHMLGTMNKENAVETITST